MLLNHKKDIIKLLFLNNLGNMDIIISFNKDVDLANSRLALKKEKNGKYTLIALNKKSWGTERKTNKKDPNYIDNLGKIIKIYKQAELKGDVGIASQIVKQLNAASEKHNSKIQKLNYFFIPWVLGKIGWTRFTKYEKITAQPTFNTQNPKAQAYNEYFQKCQNAHGDITFPSKLPETLHSLKKKIDSLKEEAKLPNKTQLLFRWIHDLFLLDGITQPSWTMTIDPLLPNISHQISNNAMPDFLELVKSYLEWQYENQLEVKILSDKVLNLTWKQ